MRAIERARLVKEALDAAYPEAACSLSHRNVFELLVATILSAQCTDERVNMVTPRLFSRYKGPRELGKASLEEVEEIIHSCGFYHSKAQSLVAASKKIAEEFSGEVPKTMEELLSLRGVARKTANVVMGTGYGINAGFVVDTHVTRLAIRLGLAKGDDPVKIEAALVKLFPRDSWTRLSHQLISHGRAVCKAAKPACQNCPMEDFCPSNKKPKNTSKNR